MNITASKLYNYIQCPHRVWRDVYGPSDEKIKEVNPFVQLLWDKGTQFEKEIISEIGKFTDLSKGAFEDRFKQTVKCMKEGKELIYQGVLIHENLAAIPDLLRKLTDGSYVPVDIKAGKGFQGVSEDDEGKPKKHYAAQLCLYVEILKELGFAKKNEGTILDIEKNEVVYFLDETMGTKPQITWQQYYEEIKCEVTALISNQKQNSPANSTMCKLCPWYYSCKKWCQDKDDLTNLFYLGRNTRDIIVADLGISKTRDLCNLDVVKTMELKKKNKRFLKRVSERLLNKLIARANIVTNIKKPIMHERVTLPEVSIELFFDIEADPTQNLVYLHGLYERREKEEKFIYFLAGDNTQPEEKQAWKQFWNYIRELPADDYVIYYYSPYEKASYKRMSKKHPDVISKDEVEQFFERHNVIDLYQIVQGKTDWPLSSYSIKDIATYLGFKWRDESPSGALSIQWYNEYIKTKDPEILKRILEYNEDDCKATMILKDKLVELNSNL